jgi:hypothetical protein
VNLELPFRFVDPSELDEHLARIDAELDALFLREVESAVEVLAASRLEPGAAAAT